MDYSWLFFGVFGGLMFGMIFIGIGYIVGKVDEDGTDKGHTGDLQRASDIGDSVFRCGIRDRISDNRMVVSGKEEEIAIVLKVIMHTFDKNLSRHEKECINDAIEIFDRERNEKGELE